MASSIDLFIKGNPQYKSGTGVWHGSKYNSDL